MRTHVALLRGINVGGRNKVAMADLRQLFSAAGHTDVATYIQSGNVVFGAPTGSDPDALGDDLEAAIVAATGIAAPVVVLERRALAAVVSANPFAGEDNPKRLHVVFRRRPLTAEETAAVLAAEERAREKGARDELVVAGAATYVHTPDGWGRSELAAQLSRLKVEPGTARNWATVGALLALFDA